MCVCCYVAHLPFCFFFHLFLSQL
ncbi:hypothetical protein AAZV13_08G005900 [Glycine max]